MTKLLAVLLCVSGILLVMHPEFIFTGNQHSKNNKILKLTKNENDTDLVWPKSHNSTYKDGEPCNYEVWNNRSNCSVEDPSFSTTGKTKMFSLDFLGYILPVIGGTVRLLDVLLLKRRPYLNEHIVEVLF